MFTLFYCILFVSWSLYSPKWAVKFKFTLWETRGKIIQMLSSLYGNLKRTTSNTEPVCEINITIKSLVYFHSCRTVETTLTEAQSILTQWPILINPQQTILHMSWLRDLDKDGTWINRVRIFTTPGSISCEM